MLASLGELRSRAECLILLDSASVVEKTPVIEDFQLSGCDSELKRKLQSALNHSLHRVASDEAARGQ